jgi:hypothetical protein
VQRAPGPPPGGGDDRPANPQPAEQATLAAFDTHDIVGLGILSYSNQDFNNFVLALVRNPGLPEKVDDIVVECGNSLYQPILDRYIAGEAVPIIEVRQVWRNTTQPMCGFSAFYEQLFPLVRQVNLALPPSRRLRVLAGDPPIDWSKVKDRQVLSAFGDRDASIADVMEREVLAKHRKALMIFGYRHLVHDGGGAVGTYERRGHPGVTFVIVAHNGFDGEERLASWPIPSLAVIKETWLAGKVQEKVDGYLYLGLRDQLLYEPVPARAILDTLYMAEMRRRQSVTGGPMGPDAILREAADTSVFFARPRVKIRDQ